MKKFFFTLVALLVASTALASIDQPRGEDENLLPAIVPQISFNVVADGVYIVVKDATSYEVFVNGVNVGEIDYVAADYFSKIIVVNAVNETPDHNKGEASDSYELGALQKQSVEAPVITTTMDDDYVYVHIQWPAWTDGVRVYTGQYEYARGPYDYEAAVTAYVREGSQWLASPETHYVVEVPSNWKVYETPDPVVTTATTDDQMIVTAKGEGTVTLYVIVFSNEDDTFVTHTVVGQGSATYAIDRGNEDIFISYYATAVADDEGYDEVVPGISRTQYDVVPKKEGVDPISGIGEMMGGKVVAGVRYFNMTGQEIPEANGVTVVVITYTDGTTSAIKVIK